MRRLVAATAIVLAVAAAALAGEGPRPKGSPDAKVARGCPAPSPEEAVQRLDEALVAGDEAAALSCRDFRWEAKLILQRLKRPDEELTKEMVNQTAELQETSFKRELQTGGFDWLRTARCQSTMARKLAEDLAVVEDRCQRGDAGETREENHVGKSADGWRVILR